MIYRDHLKYRPLCSCNVHKIADFIKIEIDPYLSIPLNQKLSAASIDDYADKLIKRADGYVVTYNEKILGIVAAYIENRAEEDKVYLTLLGVAESVRRCGIGSCLMKKLILKLPEGCMLYTHVDEKNENAWKAYQKFGFRQESIQKGRRSIFFVKG